jgi:hypothetical protein
MKSTEKSIRAWYETLPDPYRDQAMRNCIDKYGPDRLDQMCMSLGHAIDMGMYWSSTLEGSSYWSSLCEKASNGTLTLRNELYEIF